MLLQPTWSRILNYETEWMSREELAAVTYDAAEELNALKLAYGRVGKSQGHKAALRIAGARAVRQRLERDATNNGPDALTSSLHGEFEQFSVSTVCDKKELFWRRRLLNFDLWGIVQALIGRGGKGVR